MRVVLDTNILIGALITKGTPPDSLYQAWLQAKQLFFCNLTESDLRSDSPVV